jgi:DNA-binding SARP family transcriptional activator/WD40 repeat protein
MEFRILGSLDVRDDSGGPMTLGGAKPRALLAMLLLHLNEPVSAERLAIALWGQDAPAGAGKTIQVHVSRLRRALGEPEVLATTPGGYRLRVRPGELDAERFAQLAAEGHRALAEDEPERASDVLREALSLWRGPALAEFAFEAFAQAEIGRLEEERLAALEARVEADLALGRHAELVGELEQLLTAHPLRERLHGQRMLALYRSGRQADALAAYRRARARLVEEIGAEPGPELRGLHDAILRQDPALAPPAQEAVELPVELEAGTPLTERAAELDWLREQWRRAHGGAGRIVLVAGAHGIGKTRLAAELGGEINRDRGAVRYASGAGVPAEARATLDAARDARRPTLIVLDDVDRAGTEIRDALDKLVDRLAMLPVLVLATAEDIGIAAALRVDAATTLGPLDASGVAAIARLYAPAGEDVPIARLVESSGGVPRRVHSAAGEWARALAVHRLGDAADRIAAERPLLGARQDELAGGIVELQAVRERDELVARDFIRCPFKGLASFDVADAEVFFGRERLVAEMVARLPGAPLLGIVGASGSGKSSALRAGLLAALAGGVLPGSERWGSAPVRPGEHPMQALTTATAYVAPRSRMVIAVDQFEEVFTACGDESERAAFVDALVARTRDPRHSALVLIAVRADFYGRCAAYPELSRLLGANHVLVGPMRRDELRRAIEQPARRAGLRVEPDLLDALIADVEGEPGALPLLSTALLELWQYRDGRRLRLSAYEHTGGVDGAVARLAESAYARLEPERRELARRIFMRLAGEGERETVVRQRIPLAELQDERDDSVAEVLAVLAAGRLVTIGDGEVEVAHEALLREWPRLSGWLEEDAQGRRLHRHLRTAAREWDAGGRDQGELYRGARLAAALDWSGAHDPELNAVERAFLEHSRTASERANRRLRLVIAGMTCLLVLALGAVGIALRERRNALDESVVAAAQRLDAQALLEDDLDRSLLLARQAVAMDDSVQTRGNLLAALLRTPAAIGVLRRQGERLVGLDVSPDGHTLALLSQDGTLTSIDTRTRRAVAPRYAAFSHDAPPLTNFDDVRFSHDGTRLAVGGEAPAILDPRSHRLLAGLQIARDRVVYSLRFAPDARTVFAVVRTMDPMRDARVSIQRFDAASGRALGPERLITRRVGSVNLMLMQDGRPLVASSSADAIVILDAATLEPLKRLPIRADRAALSADDRTLLVGGPDGSVHFIDLETGQRKRASVRHAAPVAAAAFTADGRRAVTADANGRAIVWDVGRATAIETLEGHTGAITALTISHDDTTLYTAGADSKVVMWDLAGTRRLGRPFDLPRGPRLRLESGRPERVPPVVALTPDGRTIATVNIDGVVNFIDARTLRPISKPFRVSSDRRLREAQVLPDGRLLVLGVRSPPALVDPHTGKEEVIRLPRDASPIRSVSLSADGRVMATVNDNGVVIGLWALPSGRPVTRPFVFPGSALGASLSPDGGTLAVSGLPGIEIIDVDTRKRRPLGGEAVQDLTRFTPDGRFLLVTSREGWVRPWSTETWKPVSGELGSHAGDLTSASMSPDGRTIATGSMHGTIRLWDVRTARPLGAPLPGIQNRAVVPEFTPDGSHLFAFTGTGRAFRWDVRPSRWAERACMVAGRPLTQTEWQQALPGHDYAPACTN